MEPGEKEEIRQRVDLAEVVSGYTTLKKSGRRFKAICPFHQEKTPSFTLDPERGLWHCFGACSTGGDVFSFLMRAEGLSFPEAAERLAERAGVQLTRRGADNETTQRERDERERLYAANAIALTFFRGSFGRAPVARDYAAKRGLAHETLEAFYIGFAPDDWEALSGFLTRWRAEHPGERTLLADAEKAGLVFPSRRGDGYTDKFRGRLIFPIHDVQERVVGFGGRLLVPAENAPKYLNSPESPIFSKSRILYALNRARKAIQAENRVVVVEGYTDAVAAHQAGFAYVVATLGTSLTEEHVRLLGRYTQNVVLSFDADAAGVRAALRAAALFEAAQGFELRVLALPPGEDPDSLLAKGDAAGFRRAIDDALTVPEFRLRGLEAACDTTSDEGRLAFLRQALPIVAAVASPLERDVLVRRLARYHPAGGTRAEESLRKELRGYSGAERVTPFVPGPPIRSQGGAVLSPQEQREGGTDYNRHGGENTGGRPGQPGERLEVPSATPPPSRRGALDIAEQTLLRAFLSDEWVFAVRRQLRPSYFSDPQAARLVEDIQPLIDGDYAPTTALDQLADGELARYANTVILGASDEPLDEAVIADCLSLLRKRRTQREFQQSLSSPEGKPRDDDELLRRWDQKARAIQGLEPADSGSD